MERLRLGAGIIVIGAALLLAAPTLADDQAKDHTAAPEPAAAGTPPATAAKPEPPTKPAAPGTPRHIDTPKQEADSLLGKEVFGADGARMGLVTNVLVDRAGHPIALVIDFGGFLGVGSRKIAIDWKLMHFHPGDSKKPVTLGLSKEQLKSAPEYKPGKTAPVVQAPKPAPAKTPAAKSAPPPEHKDQQEAKPAANPAPAPDHPAPK
jgi:sporulation protein YlmC with PRC-barrel domain